MRNWIKCENCGIGTYFHSLGLCRERNDCYGKCNRYKIMIKKGNVSFKDIKDHKKMEIRQIAKIIAIKHPELVV